MVSSLHRMIEQIQHQQSRPEREPMDLLELDRERQDSWRLQQLEQQDSFAFLVRHWLDRHLCHVSRTQEVKIRVKAHTRDVRDARNDWRLAIHSLSCVCSRRHICRWRRIQRLRCVVRFRIVHVRSIKLRSIHWRCTHRRSTHWRARTCSY